MSEEKMGASFVKRELGLQKSRNVMDARALLHRTANNTVEDNNVTRWSH